MQKITRLKIKNFKSYRELDVTLNNFNLVIGSNASGKSNFVCIFEFLHHISSVGLEDAISQQGGIDWIRNVNLPITRNLEMEIHLEGFDVVQPIGRKRDRKGLEILEICYKFKIKFLKEKESFEVIEEMLESPIRIVPFQKNKKEGEPSEVLDTGSIVLKRFKGDQVDGSIYLEKGILSKAEMSFLMPMRKFLTPPGFGARQELVILKGFMVSVASFYLQRFLRDIQFFDIDPKLSKKAYSITGKKELESDGSNLALVLSRMIKQKDTKETLQEILKSLLPFIKEFSVQQQDDGSLITYLSETFCHRKPIPASFISDGTMNLLSLLVALYSKTSDSPTVVIEEPDKNLHPFLISKLVEILKDISETRERQMIITTHNPQIVKHVKLENILLISRDKSYSKVSRPIDSEEVREFLKGDLGVEDLYLQNLLE